MNGGKNLEAGIIIAMNALPWLLLCLISVTLPALGSEPVRVPGQVPQTLPDGVSLAAVITDTRLPEISGLTASRRHPGVFWMHNDSHDAQVLYAVDGEGHVRASLELPVANIDWEDIASYERDGRAFLLVADTGDNGGLRQELVVHEVEEPQTLTDARAELVRSIRFRWPDGPRDCEALTVDMATQSIWLVSKKRKPPELFRLPLFPDAPDQVQVAEKQGELTGIVQPTAQYLKDNPVYGKYRSQITAADISADGQWFAVMSYLHVYLWPRHAAGWAAALAVDPQRLELPWMAQAEAMGFDPADQVLWISSEHLPAPLIRMDLEALTQAPVATTDAVHP